MKSNFKNLQSFLGFQLPKNLLFKNQSFEMALAVDWGSKIDIQALEKITTMYGEKNGGKHFFTPSESGIPEYKLLTRPPKYIYVISSLNNIQILIDSNLVPSLYIGKTRTSRMCIGIVAAVPLSTLQKACKFLRY